MPVRVPRLTIYRLERYRPHTRIRYSRPRSGISSENRSLKKILKKNRIFSEIFLPYGKRHRPGRGYETRIAHKIQTRIPIDFRKFI